jgi:hypothetical protein
MNQSISDHNHTIFSNLSLWFFSQLKTNLEIYLPRRLTQALISERKMLESVAQYLSSNCFSWRADKMRKQMPKGPAENTFYHKFYVVRKLGSGGYGTVFLVARRSDNKRFAAKIVPQARCRRTTWCTVRQVSISTLWSFFRFVRSLLCYRDKLSFRSEREMKYLRYFRLPNANKDSKEDN